MGTAATGGGHATGAHPSRNATEGKLVTPLGGEPAGRLETAATGREAAGEDGGGALERRGWSRRRLAEAPLRGRGFGWAVGNRRHGAGEAAGEDGGGGLEERRWNSRRLAEAPLRGRVVGGFGDPPDVRRLETRATLGRLGWWIGVGRGVVGGVPGEGGMR